MKIYTGRKYTIILGMVLLLVLSAAGCGSSKDGSQEATTEEPFVTGADGTEVLSGGWEVVDEVEPASLPKGVEKTFSSVAKATDDNYIPMAYMAKKEGEVLLLCKSTKDNALETLDIKGSGAAGQSITVKDFRLEDYSEAEGAKIKKPAEGDWQIPKNYTKADLSAEPGEAFNLAVKGFSGNELVPMAYLGSQIVAGTNYMYLCHSSLTTADPVEALAVVTVYKDLEGSAEITNICSLDLEEVTGMD